MIYGSYNIDLDIEFYRNEAKIFLESEKVETAGRYNFNKFISLTKESKIDLTKYFANTLARDYDWHWEYFHSGQPVGLHTDYTAFPNVWNTAAKQECHVVVGIIIPLEWNSKQPYTVNYNKITDVPRKLKYMEGEMRYVDNYEIFNYRDKWEYDTESLVYNPKKTENYKQFADLKIHSVYKWEIGTAMVFDTKRWHSSSWFLSDAELPKVSVEYKRSILGLGSININK
jgi:hypothetical protein